MKMEKMPEIEINHQSIEKIINLVEESLFTKDRIKLISGIYGSSLLSQAVDNLVRLGYIIIENIQTLTQINNNKTYIKLIIILKRINNFNKIYDEDTIEIIYKPIKVEKLQIFNCRFVNINEYKCKIIYKDKIYKLKEYLDDIDNNYNTNDLIKIKLKGINNITDMSYMFSYCYSLIALPDISKWNTQNVINMKEIFYNCTSLISLPDISNWNTSNVKNMSDIFSGCESLISLPDISKWDIRKVKYMREMFYNCNSLISLPDLTKWNTQNIEDIGWMFANCKSLITLPDISKWNINNVNDMSYMFSECYSLILFPNISKWNTNNIKKMESMFRGCVSLISLPDISKLNI